MIPQLKNMLELTDPGDVKTARQVPRKKILTVAFQLFTFSYLKPDLQDKKHTIRCLVSIEKGDIPLSLANEHLMLR